MRLVKASVPAIVAILLAVCLIHQASAQISTAVVDISLVSQNPYPAEPGSNVNIEIEIENTGTIEAKNVIIEIVAKDPFTLLPGQELKKTINQIGPQSSVKETYDLFVATGAVSSSYNLDFKIYKSSDPNTYSTESVSVSVQGSPKLVIESVKTIPDDIEPGGSVTLDFRIKNIGSGTARQAQAKLESSSTYLVPVLSGGLVYIGDIMPGETKDAMMELSIDSLAEYKTYTATLNLQYKDESNTPASDTFDIGIPVTGSIRLEIINIEPNYERQLLDIEVANKGTTDAKSLEVKLLLKNETIGIDYLSILKSTKKTTFSFPLVLEGKGELVMNYVGPGLEQNQLIKEITLNFEPQSGNGTVNTIFGIIVILVIIYIVWRKFFRKKRHKARHLHNTKGK